MRIENDEQLYEFARLVDGDGSGEGTRLLLEYWKNSGKLALLVTAAGIAINANADELIYVVACEDCLEELRGTLAKFIASFCAASAAEYNADPQVCTVAGEITNILRRGFGSPRSLGWQGFYEQLSKASLSLTAHVDRLFAMSAAGNAVRFECTATAEDFLCGGVSFDGTGAKRLVFRGIKKI